MGDHVGEQVVQLVAVFMGGLDNFEVSVFRPRRKCMASHRAYTDSLGVIEAINSNRIGNQLTTGRRTKTRHSGRIHLEEEVCGLSLRLVLIGARHGDDVISARN